MLSSSQTSVRQLLFQRTQVAVLLAQGCHVARPGVFLAKLLVQDTHLCEERAGLLGDQAFSTLPIQLDGLARTRLFGGLGDLEGDVAESIIPIAIVVGVAVAILLRHPFQQVQSAVDIPFIQGDLNQARGMPAFSSLRKARSSTRCVSWTASSMRPSARSRSTRSEVRPVSRQMRR